MRQHQQITEVEYIIPNEITLISETDLQGAITKCNDAFVAASGFSETELIGQPHNLVRHPDVPKAVFEDLWKTLKTGAPWSQIVKNRRADGGFYWVRANVTPVFTNQQITGYMSVRAEATQDEKRLASQTYKDIAHGKAKIRNGKVIYGVDWGKYNFFSCLLPQWQLTTLVGLFAWLPYILIAISANLSSWEIVLVSTMMFTTSYFYGLSINKFKNGVVQKLQIISSGGELQPEFNDPRYFKGEINGSITSTYLAMRESHEETISQLESAKKLQLGIDQVSSNVMIADVNHNIIYMNSMMKMFLTERAVRFQEVYPEFSVEKMIGENIGIFHKNPVHQQALLDSLSEPAQFDIEVAGFQLSLCIIPVFNRAGQHNGTLVEWKDKTSEIQLLEEVNSAISAAKEGILDNRIDLSTVDGLALKLSQSINELIDSVEQPINAAVEVANAMVKGDLTHKVEGEFHGRYSQMQDSLNAAIENLANLTSKVKVVASNVLDSTEQIHQGSIDLNDRTQNQAASLEQTSSTMEEMTSTVTQNAENAKQAANNTQQVEALAKSGVQVMNNAIQSMEQINESSQKINDIIGLIDSIAFQTNLLALNAAVEAARAGEHGRGFAVVAGEVRNLAQKSSEASKEIRQLIEDTVQKISEGSQHVRGSGDALNTIFDSVTNVHELINEIAASSLEQSEGINQVNQAISQIDTSVQQNAALVEETTAASEELSVMSKQMITQVKAFKTPDDVPSNKTINLKHSND